MSENSNEDDTIISREMIKKKTKKPIRDTIADTLDTAIKTGAVATGNPAIIAVSQVVSDAVSNKVADVVSTVVVDKVDEQIDRTVGTIKETNTKKQEQSNSGSNSGETPVDIIVKKIGQTTDNLSGYITAPVEEYVTDICIGGVVEALGYEKKKAPYVSMLFRMIRDTPKQTGVIVDDYNRWSGFVDKYVEEFESMSGQTIEMYINEDHIKSFENITKKDGQFLKSREEIIHILKEMRSFRGLVENFLETPIKNFRDHSVTLTDRFNEFLPQWINDIGLGDIGIRLIGDVKSQPAMSEKSLKIIGFAYYDPSEEYTNAKSRLSENPFEKVIGNPQGVDEFGNEYHYKYFGPNNPLPNGKPINIVDRLARDHDYAYKKYGYNTKGAREADRILVQSLKKYIESGDIHEKSPYKELYYAKKAIEYFSSIDQK